MEDINDFIRIKGARVHNLKNISVNIPRGKFIVITGLSGSGKSSLAFDTLYAEGQRRYVESLSAYARQFLGSMSKPEVDYIKGIPPAIAIEQKVITRNSRSTVGTSTEIYDYLKLLFARIGKTISPKSGTEVKKHTTEDVIKYILNFPKSTKFIILSPILLPNERNIKNHLEILQQQGYNRIALGEEIIRIDDAIKESDSIKNTNNLLLVIDRLMVDSEASTISRATDSIETAFLESKGDCIIWIYNNNEIERKHFSSRFEADGIKFKQPSEYLFNFNNPIGACPTCEGLGKITGIDEDLVIPNKSLSIYEQAIACWRGDSMKKWNDELIMNANKFNFPIHKPYFKLTDEQKTLLWNGNEYFHGLNNFFEFLKTNQYKIQFRVMLARYRGKTICPDCHGSRLKKEAEYVKVADKSITELITMSIKELKKFFIEIKLNKNEFITAKRLLIEINNRLQFLIDVGLGYLTLNRMSNTLSGGESQRINLAKSLGSSLVGSLYILDEPSIGLHSKDTQLLIKVLKELQSLGNTVVVVEHDEEIIKAADYVIDIGPKAGRLGGEIVFEGKVSNITQKIAKKSNSLTLKYITGIEKIPTPKTRRPWSNYIEVISATENNLKGINVKFPLNVITVVSGVSGSGKTSLVRDVFYKYVSRYYEGINEKTDPNGRISGSLHLAKNIEYVNQNQIGKSTRSNPVTYLKAYDDLRRLMASQQLAKQMGFSPAFFSFNVDGGRCEECHGEGVVTVEMQFMADIVLECESCHGKRFKKDILEVLYRGKNIYDILEMTVNQAIDFFSEDKENTYAKTFVKHISPLQKVGLGYLKLGQSSSTLSGGENQRVKLAFYLSQEKPDPTIFVFDEPTTGLHFNDIKTLMTAFNSLIEKGHTVIIIEHNMDIIRCADHIIDMGPEGGSEGGNLIFEGTPEELVKCKNSYTGKYLKMNMDMNN